MSDMQQLYARYRADLGDEDVTLGLRSAARWYLRRRAATVGDAAAVAIALGEILDAGTFDPDALTPQMEEAFALAFPHKELSSVADMSSEELAGLVSAWKGKLFEVVVRDELNDGRAIGDLFLEPGQSAELADSATQPAWDLLVRGAGGEVVDQIQLKATGSLAYIESTLEKYPDTKILTTAEIGSQVDDPEALVSASSIANEELTGALDRAIDDGLSESLFDGFVPGIPIVFIGVTEMARVLSGRSTVTEALYSGAQRGWKTALSGGVGWTIASFTGLWILGVFGAFVTRMFLRDAPRVASSTGRGVAPSASLDGIAALLARERKLLARYAG